MSEHKAYIEWQANPNEDFINGKYNRDHKVTFENGVQITASAAAAWNGESTQQIDPEQLFVAALSNCHMLTFLAVAAKRKFIVNHYSDAAIGILEKNAEGKYAVTTCTLNPKATFIGEKQPTTEDIDKLHEKAHQHCFISNSAKTDVIIKPDYSTT